MRRDIDIALLRAFVAVSETGGMTSAGRVLNLTQAAISQQIKRLEELMQVELVDRSEKQLRLTSAGERLLAPAQRLIALNDEVFATMIKPEFEGEVRLGVPHDIVGVYMPAVLRAFQQAHPRVRISLHASTTPKLIDLMQKGEIDLTLTTEPQPATEPDMLLADPLVWTGARGGTAWRRNPLPVAMGDETCAFRAHALHALRQAGRSWHLMFQVGDTTPMQAMLEADMAIAPMLASVVPSSLEILKATDMLPALPTFYINLHARRPGQNARADVLAEQIRNEFSCRFKRAA
ncbi:MAG: LysR substrate-binding domain-containing protein [Hyphomicrobiaceae bacterium]